MERIKAARAKVETALGADELRDLAFGIAMFILARPPDGDARRLSLALRDRGILVRHWDRPRLEDKIRVTVGTDKENRALVEALKDLLI